MKAVKAVKAAAASASRAWTAVRAFMRRRRVLPSGERIGKVAVFAAAAFLLYALGVVSADFRLFPSGVIRSAYTLPSGEARPAIASGDAIVGEEQALDAPAAGEADEVRTGMEDCEEVCVPTETPPDEQR